MSVTYKRILRKSPIDPKSDGKYYPQLIVWGKSATLASISKRMKEKSSLSQGDILNVISGFVEELRTELYNGHAVNIENFGVFSLSATTKGTEKKEDCLSENIQAIRICFRASNSIRPNLNPERREDRIDFVDLDAQLKLLNGGEGEEPEEPGDGGGEAPDPTI
ncbi:HU family DNA-binding protein [Bacteroides reticulotermitis]|uniref:HU family DNA-binding protein n=1 Tax=Bacteroides reticulotermitis TaxID=1133319 RepID=UPI001605A87F|nr:HU family DNA-binding protein [Bacteroides reticulotermitis]